jgi:hypothetical protein
MPHNGFRFAPSYARLLATMEGDDEGFVWLGEVGIRVPHDGVVDEDWVEELAGLRWRGMHPDLIPFARDSWGNRFCFYRPGAPRGGEGSAIVYWLYETFTAVPVASTCEGFLRWLGLITWAHERDPNYEMVEAGDSARLMEVLDSLNLGVDAEALLPMPAPERRDVLAASLALDPACPAGLVTRGLWRAQQGDTFGGTEDARLAAFTFPDFAAAYAAQVTMLAGERDSSERFDALLMALRCSLCFSGDPDMPWFRDVPVVEAETLAESLATHKRWEDIERFDPIWDLVQRLDPSSPASWCEVALAYADTGAFAEAVPMACNALHFSLSDPTMRHDVERLLVELYEALGWSWHSRAVLLGR